MKTTTSLFIAAAICMFAVSGCKSIVTFDTLPENARIFLTQNFPDSPVSYAVMEFNEYSVTLVNGTEIEFNGKGEWEKVDMNHGIVPDAVLATLPASINSFLTASFANVPIEKIEKGFLPAYKVELVNGLEVEFNSKEICRNIDD